MEPDGISPDQEADLEALEQVRRGDEAGATRLFQRWSGPAPEVHRPHARQRGRGRGGHAGRLPQADRAGEPVRRPRVRRLVALRDRRERLPRPPAPERAAAERAARRRRRGARSPRFPWTCASSSGRGAPPCAALSRACPTSSARSSSWPATTACRTPRSPAPSRSARGPSRPGSSGRWRRSRPCSPKERPPWNAASH